MTINDEMIGLKVPREVKQALDMKYPDARERNNVIRVLLKKLLEGSVIVKPHEVEQRY